MDPQILNKIFNGETAIEDDEHLKTLHYLFQGNLDYFSDTLSSLGDKITNGCKTDQEKIELLRNYFVWTPVPESYFTRFAKSSKSSNYFLQLGQDYYEMRCWKEALRAYNLAIMFGEWDEDLGESYFNRADLFAKLRKFDLAKTDYEMCSKYHCTNLSKEKLIQSKLSKYTEGFAPSFSDYHVHDHDLVDSKYFRVVKTNPKIEYAADFVKIEETPERGRCLVAARNISAGEVILAQKAFAVLLKNLLTWDTEHCHFCYKPIESGIPCGQCTFAIYCTQECLDKSCSSSHQYEHHYFPYLNAIKSPRRDFLAAQIVLKLGPKFVFDLYQNWESFPSSAFDENTQIYQSSSYSSIYHLVSHANQLKSIEKISNGFRSLVLLHLVEERTDFLAQFVDEKPRVLDNFKNFVASLILHHIENIPYNVISMSKLTNDDEDAETVSYGMALFSLLSLANHSCDPNAIPLRRPQSTKVSLIALKNIKPGDEICISYSPLFTTMDTKARQEFLSQRYHFNCNCIPCVDNWFVDVNNLESVKNTQPAKGKKSELQRMYDNLVEIERLIVVNRNYLKALDVLKPFLNTLTQNYSSRFPLTLFAQELMKKGLVGLVNLNRK